MRQPAPDVLGQVGELRTYPVTSLAGVALAAVELGPGGLAGDRELLVAGRTASRSGARTHRAWRA